MSHEYIEKDQEKSCVDKYPTFIREMESGSQLTIGDLHGNAALLLFHLVKWGAATLTEAQYKDLYRCITQTVKTFKIFLITNAKLITQFKEILSQIHFKSDYLLRLIGDETADRGANDYFTLLILQRLKECGVHVDILLSNHGLDFIRAYEEEDFTPRIITADATVSLSNLKVLLDEHIISQDEVEDLIQSAYKPALKIITYSLNEVKDRVTIYSHAPIGINTIESLCEKFKIDYHDEDIQQLIKTINLINSKFQSYVEENRVRALFTRPTLDIISEKKDSNIEETDVDLFKNSPIEVCTWNRVYSDKFIIRPQTHKGYELCYVHGHDSSGPKYPHVYCLDSNFGKAELEGTYKILYSKELTIIPEEEIKRRATAIKLSAPDDAAVPTDEIQPIREAETKREAIRNFILNHEKFQQQEKDLLAKAEKLTSTRYDTTKDEMREAFLAAENLKTNILEARQKLQKGGSVEDFHKEYKEAIEAAMPILKTHRGWKQSLLNILNCLVSLINCAISKKENKFKFFITPTDSEKKANTLKENLPVVINEAQRATL